MPTIITRGAGSAQGLGYASSSAAVTYVEDVFSTYLYTGNGSTQTITNGIDLSGKGGLTWIKQRTGGSLQSNWLMDTVRGAGQAIRSDTTNASVNVQSDFNQVFLSSGFSFNATSGAVNGSGNTYASWTFREQPKFFDIVTYTGNGVAGRSIAHNLGSLPGCIIVKATSVAGQDWLVYHRSLSTNGYLLLNSTGAESVYPYVYNPTTTTFDVASSVATNGSGTTYVAYLFAHNAGGFGLTGTDNVISCGSYVTTGGGSNTINLGWEPQWVLVKRATDILGDPDRDAWHITDSMRGMTAFDGAGSTSAAELRANASDAEVNLGDFVLNATGFTVGPGNWNGSTAATYIYIAIRRGPMKVPTSGTSVFLPNDGTGSTSGQSISTSFPVDLAMSAYKTQGFVGLSNDRLRGIGNTNTAGLTPALQTSTTQAESVFSPTNPWFINAWNNSITRGSNGVDPVGGIVTWLFRRAPGFFDEVCYTGTGSATTFTHNLGVVPELMIVKERNGANGWQVYSASLTNTEYLILNTSAGVPASSATRWNSTTPTSTVFSVGTHGATNGSGQNFVNYLFATCAGVSKVGSYTGTGTTLQIDCGFTAGARFVLIKRTDSTGDWYVWDSARGIVAGNDPYLLLNSTAAEVTGTDYVDTASSGFEISSTAPAAINANGGSFIFLAIA